MSRLTVNRNMRILDENSIVAKFKGKEDVAAISKQPGVKKKALADVANTINQKFADSQTPKKKGGIQLLPNKGQFKVFEKSDKKLNLSPLNKSSKLLLQSTKKKLNAKEKLLLSKDDAKQINEKPIKDAEKLAKTHIETITKEIKANDNKEYSLKKDNIEKPKPVDLVTVVHVDTEDEEEAVEEFGCNHCLESEEDDYEDILPKYLRLTPEQITASAMCWEPKPTVIEQKPFIMEFLPEPPVYDPEHLFELDPILLTF